MKVLIESDGIGTGTKITHKESGADISNCIGSLDIHVNPRDIARAEVQMVLVGMKLEAVVRPKGTNRQMAEALRNVATRIEQSEINVDVFQIESDTRENTGLNQKYATFLSTGGYLFIKWE